MNTTMKMQNTERKKEKIRVKFQNLKSFKYLKINNLFNKKDKDKYIENEPDHLPVGISIKDLSRKFKERTVVDNLSLNFFEGQITALLGHNGAGKSTTM